LATIGWLKSMGHCSYSTIEAWMEDVLQVPVSRGYLAKICTGTISASLADAYDELTEAIPRQENQGLGRAAPGPVTAAVFGLAPPRRDDGRGFSSFDADAP